MKPAERRLLRGARAARRQFALAGAASALDAVLVVAAAWLLASIVAAAVAGQARPGEIAGLLGIAGGRALLGALAAALPPRAAAAVKLGLRRQILPAAVRASDRPPAGEVVAIAGRGLDGLDPYFARYLPELIRGATVPVAVLVALLAADLTSALIVLLTLPLIPLFGALVGSYTAQRTNRQWRALAVLSHHFLDVVTGLPTLKVFGRARAQAATIAAVTEQHRVATMATLRVAMLSALVLELAATLSVALVAVSIGLRMVHGGLNLELGLFLLVLAPEAYLPLRRAAAEYHASVEGVTAAERGFGIIDAAGPPDPPATAGPVPAQRPPAQPALPPGLDVDRVTVRFRDRGQPALDALQLTIPAGQVIAVTGPSGSGKTTLLRVLLGLQPAEGGAVRVDGRALSAMDLAAWHRRTAWLSQQPHLVAAPVADNIRLGRPGASDAEVRAAAARAGADGFVAGLARGYATPLADGGAGLSAGQRQRLALARVFLRTGAGLVLLDEPTAHLDLATEASIVDALRDFLPGRTTVLVTHRPALLELADHVVDLGAAVVS